MAASHVSSIGLVTVSLYRAAGDAPWPWGLCELCWSSLQASPPHLLKRRLLPSYYLSIWLGERLLAGGIRQLGGDAAGGWQREAWWVGDGCVAGGCVKLGGWVVGGGWWVEVFSWVGGRGVWGSEGVGWKVEEVWAVTAGWTVGWKSCLVGGSWCRIINTPPGTNGTPLMQGRAREPSSAAGTHIAALLL